MKRFRTVEYRCLKCKLSRRFKVQLSPALIQAGVQSMERVSWQGLACPRCYELAELAEVHARWEKDHPAPQFRRYEPIELPPDGRPSHPAMDYGRTIQETPLPSLTPEQIGVGRGVAERNGGPLDAPADPVLHGEGGGPTAPGPTEPHGIGRRVG